MWFACFACTKTISLGIIYFIINGVGNYMAMHTQNDILTNKHILTHLRNILTLLNTFFTPYKHVFVHLRCLKVLQSSKVMTKMCSKACLYSIHMDNLSGWFHKCVLSDIKASLSYKGFSCRYMQGCWYHWNGNVILGKFLSQAAPKVVILQLSVKPLTNIPSKWQYFCLRDISDHVYQLSIYRQGRG